MKNFLFVLLATTLIFGQASRSDPSPAQTTVTFNGLTVVTTIPGAAVSVCLFQLSGTSCTVLATTYTNNLAGTPCPTSAQIVLASTQTCVGNADTQGNFGFWALPGLYSYCVSGAGVTPYCNAVTVSPNVNAVNSISAGTINVSILNNIYNPALCGSASPAVWCAGTDMGGWINSAVAAIGGSGGEIYIPGGLFTYSTPIVLNRLIYMHGSSTIGSYLHFTGTTGCAIVIGDNNAGTVYTTFTFNNYSPGGAIEDIGVIGDSSSNTDCGVYLGGSDGQPGSPPVGIDAATNFGDHFNLNRVRFFESGGSGAFGDCVKIGNNAWSITVFESILSFCANGYHVPANSSVIINSGENLQIVSSSVSNNTAIGLKIDTGSFVNVTAVATSFDFNATWNIQNGTSSSNNAVSLESDYMDNSSGQKFIQNFGYFNASGGYWNGIAGAGSYLIDNERAQFNVSGGQMFNGGVGGTFVFNQSGQCVDSVGVFYTGNGAFAWPICGVIDPSGNGTFHTLNLIPSNGQTVLCSSGDPVVASGFNTNGTVSTSTANGTCAFIITIGNGIAGSTGTLTMPTANTGWNCFATNGSRPDFISETASGSTSVTLTNYGVAFGATNWTNGDAINVACFGR